MGSVVDTLLGRVAPWGFILIWAGIAGVFKVMSLTYSDGSDIDVIVWLESRVLSDLALSRLGVLLIGFGSAI